MKEIKNIPTEIVLHICHRKVGHKSQTFLQFSLKQLGQQIEADQMRGVHYCAISVAAEISNYQSEPAKVTQHF